MKLHEIIAQNENHTESINIAFLLPYKKSLLVYYKDFFCSEPVLMVTDVFNAVQYGKMVPSGEFYEAVCAYLDVDYINKDQDDPNFDADLFAQYETIAFNSTILTNL